MAKFILAYHQGQPPSSPEGGAEHMARYKQWMQGLGEALISPANPFGPSKLVSSSGVSEGGGLGQFMGYSVVEVADMDAALEAARTCPFVEFGDIEVARLMAGPKG